LQHRRKMIDEQPTNGEAPKPLRLQFSLRSLLIATAVIAVDLAIVARAGPAAVLGLIAALTSLTLGIGGMLIAAVIERRSRLDDQPRRGPRISLLMMGTCSIWLFMLSALAVIGLTVIATIPSLFGGTK
jgi:hypothetical protein